MNGGKKMWLNATSDIMAGRNIKLGSYHSYTIDHDIKHMGFVFARYKFAAKMMANYENINVLELGCNYGFGSCFISQETSCKQYVGVDFDEEAIAEARLLFNNTNTTFICEDFLGRSYKNIISGGDFQAILSIDVIEHIDKSHEDEYMRTIVSNLSEDGFAVLGTPNITMSPYASPASQRGHVNLFDQKRFFELCHKYFHSVFIFGMNDETLHTGFYPMSCYILALLTHKINNPI